MTRPSGRSFVAIAFLTAVSAAASVPGGAPRDLRREAAPEGSPWAQLRLTDPPTDAELRRTRLFAEPLIPMASVAPSSSEEVCALATALRAWVDSGMGDEVEPLHAFLAAYPRSRWRASLLMNLGIVLYRSGHFSAALESYEEAWDLARGEAEARSAGVADRAGAELALLYSRLGRTRTLRNLLAELEPREVHGASQKVAQAREGVNLMAAQPGESFRCGPLALSNVVARLRPGSPPDPRIDALRSTDRGLPLTAIARLADELGMGYAMARREGAAVVPLPAVVHWKSGHFAALVDAVIGEDGATRYQVEDPTFADRLWVTEKALRTEGSGYYLLAKSSLGDGWATVKHEEGARIWGKGRTTGADGDATGAGDGHSGGDNDSCSGAGPGEGPGEGPGPGPDGPEPGPGAGPGPGGPGDHGGPGGPGGVLDSGGVPSVAMPTYSFHAMLISLRIVDTPLFYHPPLGPPIAFTVTYVQKDISQPAEFSYPNLGNNWTFGYLSYVEDDPRPGHEGENVSIYKRGGGIDRFEGYASSTQQFSPQFYTLTRLERTSSTSYELTFPDGARQVYGHPDGIGNPRRVFLTEVIDPQGNAVTLDWTDNQLTTITDAAGQTTTLAYEHPHDEHRITSVTDPFGRTAQLTYHDDEDTNQNQVWDEPRQLKSIEDVAGMTTELGYGDDDFVSSMATPYGVTTFAYQPPPETEEPAPDPLQTWLMATDPLGRTERIEFRHVAPGIPDAESAVPASMSVENQYLSYRNTFYWNKQAWGEHGLDYTKADISHWVHKKSPSGGGLPVRSRIIDSFKRPLEERVWYQYRPDGFSIEGDRPYAMRVGRRMDDASTALYIYEYNNSGFVTRVHDPLLRRTDYVYDANERDLLFVRQHITEPPFVQHQIAAYTYNSTHQPLTYTDAAGRVTRYTYNGAGQPTSVCNPLQDPDPPAHECTYFSYDSTPGNPPYLVSIERPMGTFTYLEYDSHGRVWKVTDTDGDVTTYEYDALDRLTRVIYPDGDASASPPVEPTFREITYDRLDVATRRDRLGNVTTYVHNDARELELVTDPEGRDVTFSYCACGQLGDMTVDGNTTTWQRDDQGRVVRKVFPDTTDIEYTYEDTTSRLKSVLDARGQTKSYVYNNDDTVQEISYTNAVVATPGVELSYDVYYPRLTSVTVGGTDVTSYTYHPVGEDGALQVATIDGPLANDTLAFDYDELGRLESRAVNGTASSVTFDELSRVVTSTDVLGAFTYGYDGLTSRLASLQYPNGQETLFTYLDAIGNRRLESIENLGPGSSSISEHIYGYDAEGRILTWSQLPGETDEAAHDDAGQLASYEWSGGLHSFSYDESGNRDTSTRTFHYNEMNQVTSWDYGTTRNLSYDANGNLEADGSEKSYEWDAENRLSAADQDVSVVTCGLGGCTTATTTYRSEFSYDGFGRRVRIKEKETTAQGTTLESDRFYLWCGGPQPCEERDAATNATTRRFLAHGFQDGLSSYFYTRDHLGSVRDVVDASGVVQTSYRYDPWGGRIAGGTTFQVPFGYAGYFVHHNANPSSQKPPLNLTLYRAYDPLLGRWLSRDPAGEFADGLPFYLTNASELNLYAYVGDSPLMYVDPFGLASDTVSKTIEEAMLKRDPQILEDILDAVSGNIEDEKAVRDALDVLRNPPGEAAKNQLDEIERAQDRVKRGKSKQQIDSTGKSKGRLRKVLDGVKSLKDALDDFCDD